MAKFYSSAVPEYQADKEQFEFVQMKDDIADATFQDKPIGFFKDAMLRFCRSKVSIVAFVGIVINSVHGNLYANDEPLALQ